MASEIAVHRPSGMELLAELARKATDPQAAIEIARQIVDLETKWESLVQSRDRFEWEKLERQAKVAFADAFKRFKDNAPKILKSKHVSFPSKKEGQSATSYYHVELDKACDLLIPALLKVGITHRWKPTDLPGGYTRMTCYLRHDLGYEEEGATLSGPADQSGGKNPIQGVGSASTYLERYTLLASLGIVATGSDNDGAEVGGLTNEEVGTMVTSISNAPTPEEAMKTWALHLETAKKQVPINYQAMVILTAARDERLKELKRAK